MPAVDTNVLVRLLVADDPGQLKQVERLIDEATRTGTTLFVPISVALELEWVLRTRYEIPKREIIETYVALLERKELDFQSEAALEHAIYYCRDTNADFADCIHVALAEVAGETPLFSFDRRAGRLANVQGLPA